MGKRFLRAVILLFFVAASMASCSHPLVGSTGEGPTPASAYPTPNWQEIPTILPEAAKGYELYSWQAGENWVFTLIAGTNRNKSFEEITATENVIDKDGWIKVSVTTLEDLKLLLDRLPAGSEVFWSGIDLTGQVDAGTLYFSYPPEETRQTITDYADELGIKLHTLENQ